MKLTLSSIVLFALNQRLCAAAMFVNAPEAEGRSLLYEAANDIVMTCYGGPGKAVGVLGDSDGSFLETLWSNYTIPAVLLDDMDVILAWPAAAKVYRLQVYIIVTNSPRQLIRSINTLSASIWWNDNAKFLIVDTAPNSNHLLSRLFAYMYITSKSGLLNVQCLFLSHLRRVIIFDSNPFMRNAPEAWHFIREAQFMKDEPPISLFGQIYKNGGKSCKDLHFPKTKNIGGYPLYFLMKPRLGAPTFSVNKHLGAKVARFHKQVNHTDPRGYRDTSVREKVIDTSIRYYYWFIDTIMIAMNASAVITNDVTTEATIALNPEHLSRNPKIVGEKTSQIIVSRDQFRFLAVTNYTDHKSQLEKILSVIDTTSQIGMCIVYVITFLFFKFFLGQAVMPALLNLVRLTCNTGLTRLPQNLAPTIYLSCLLMFVVTLQGIYTGNLATLLTSTISYPNVETKKDIAKLGYKVYSRKSFSYKLADPLLDGHVIEIPESKRCMEYLLSDPLAVCVVDYYRAVYFAVQWNLHLSRESIISDYLYYRIGRYNPFKRRLEQIMTTWTETGVRREDTIWETLHRKHLVDDDVRSNVERRIMTLDDLGFAFVILGVGLTFASICFVGEIVICRVRLKIAKRRNRLRARLAWGVPKKKFSLFPSLNLVLNARRFLSKRR